MTSHKIPGCCSLCDAPCFEIRERWAQGGKHAGEPKSLGPPNPDAQRIEFMLFDGRRTSMTFCGGCAGSLGGEEYTLLWRRNLAGYLREQNGNPEKFKDEFSNGLMCELGRVTLKELMQHGR